MPIALLLWS